MTDNALAPAPLDLQDTETNLEAAVDNPRLLAAQAIVKHYVPWSAGAGIVPLPGVDLAALLGVQLRMLSKLADVYDVRFREQAAKSVVASLLGTAASSSVAGGLASAFKAVPVIGTLFGMLVLPAVGAAATYAIGKVFITHFESGGTFLDLDPSKVEAHFRSEFAQASAKGGNTTDTVDTTDTPPAGKA